MNDISTQVAYVATRRVRAAAARMGLRVTAPQLDALVEEVRLSVQSVLAVDPDVTSEARWLVGDDAIDALKLFAQGCTEAMVSRRLDLPPGRVKKLMERAYGILRAHNRVHVVVLAARWGLLSVHDVDPAPKGSRACEPQRTIPRT